MVILGFCSGYVGIILPATVILVKRTWGHVALGFRV